MAEGGVGGADDDEALSITSMVECDICMEVMVKPQALLCLHHFCLDCTNKLDRVTEDEAIGVSCPFCRKFTSENAIQYSFMMNNLIEIYLKKQGFEVDGSGGNIERRCTQCDRPDVKYVCTDCLIDLCDLCKDRHLRIPNCKDHTVSEMDKADDDKGINIIEKYCQKHPCNVLKYSCIPCSQAICVDCKIESHDTHKTETVAEAFKTIQKTAQTYIEQIYQQCEGMSLKLASIQSLKDSVSCMVEESRLQIEQEREALIAKIQEDSEALLEEVASFGGAKIKELNIMEEGIQDTLASNESLLTWSNTIVNTTQGSGALCELQGGLLEKIKSCAAEKQEDQEAIADFRNLEFRPADLQKNLVGEVVLVGVSEEEESVEDLDGKEATADMPEEGADGIQEAQALPEDIPEKMEVLEKDDANVFAREPGRTEAERPQVVPSFFQSHVLGLKREWFGQSQPRATHPGFPPRLPGQAWGEQRPPTIMTISREQQQLSAERRKQQLQRQQQEVQQAKRLTDYFIKDGHKNLQKQQNEENRRRFMEQMRERKRQEKEMKKPAETKPVPQQVATTAAVESPQWKSYGKNKQGRGAATGLCKQLENMFKQPDSKSIAAETADMCRKMDQIFRQFDKKTVKGVNNPKEKSDRAADGSRQADGLAARGLHSGNQHVNKDQGHPRSGSTGSRSSQRGRHRGQGDNRSNKHFNKGQQKK